MSNGHALPRSVDQRTLWARRFRDLLALHLNDLGGEDAASEAEKAIVRRACTLIVELERMEEGFALAGEASLNQLEAYQRTGNSLRRLLESVGLQRRPRNVTPPTLDEYLRNRAQREVAE